MQRIRLATQIGSQLVGVLYILDEPSIGLHPRDNKKLIDTLIQLRDLGNTIILNHPGGFITVFAHTDSNIVVAGMSVKKGQIIANVGETGNSKGPHLHFEMWKNTEVLDPREIILEYKQKDVSIR